MILNIFNPKGHIVLLIIFLFAVSALGQGSGRLKWAVHIYQKNSDYIEIVLDTRNFAPQTCLYDMSVRVNFLDTNGRVKHRQRFELARGVEQGSVYMQWLPHHYQDVTSARGEYIDYGSANCGTRLTRLDCPQRSFWQKLFGIESRCKKKIKERISEEQADSVGPNLIRKTQSQEIDLNSVAPRPIGEPPKGKSP
jgi:hypothetical protein